MFLFSYPADPVSLGLAYLAKQETVIVPESRLCYGFESKPEESATKSINTNVPEENLWAMNRDIIQLKQPKQTKQISEEEYEEFDEIQDNGPNYLGYKDIGYCEEEKNNPTFEVQEQSSGPICRDRLPRPNIGNCECRPGSLILQQQVIYPHPSGQLRECEYRDSSREISPPQSEGCDCGCQSPIIHKLRGCLRRYK